jgi:cellulose synthase/poly-beta-1,6-N-acetylglucosamine synthase-like glycosyltransferase
MKDLTLIIPFYNDSDIRLKNLIELSDTLSDYKINHTIIESIDQSFKKEDEIIRNSMAEKSEYCHVILFLNGFTQYIKKSELINSGIDSVETKYAGWHDCDARFKKDAYIKAYDLLESGSLFVRPYNGSFLNVRGYRYNGKLFDNIGLQKQTLHCDSCGGALLFNTEKFIEIGGMNEKFKGWGYEDNELKSRIYKYGYKVDHIDNFECYHLDHPRANGISSERHPHYTENMDIYNMSKNMSLGELKKWEFSIFNQKK